MYKDLQKKYGFFFSNHKKKIKGTKFEFDIKSGIVTQLCILYAFHVTNQNGQKY